MAFLFSHAKRDQVSEAELELGVKMKRQNMVDLEMLLPSARGACRMVL